MGVGVGVFIGGVGVVVIVVVSDGEFFVSIVGKRRLYIRVEVKIIYV